MTDQTQDRIAALIKRIPSLTEGQIYWLDRVVQMFDCERSYQLHKSDLLNARMIEDFGDALRIHHCFSSEPLSKDRFEYVLVQILAMNGHDAVLAPKGNRGHDLTVDGCPISLKTQANKSIRKNKIWISKFMELGKGKWGDNPDDLVSLRKMYFDHQKSYDRIFTLRCLGRGPTWKYELVEIPKKILRLAKSDELEMKMDSKQYPKPGYCYVRDKQGKDIFQLYFDGGSERKLQIKNLLKAYCVVHATWEFFIPQG